jgi:hypothetical protein
MRERLKKRATIIKNFNTLSIAVGINNSRFGFPQDTVAEPYQANLTQFFISWMNE